MSSPEQNYLSLFAMGYPVQHLLSFSKHQSFRTLNFHEVFSQNLLGVCFDLPLEVFSKKAIDKLRRDSQDFPELSVVAQCFYKKFVYLNTGLINHQQCFGTPSQAMISL